MIFSDGMSDHVWLGNDSSTEHNISASQRADLLQLPAAHESKEEPITHEDGETRKENAVEPIVDVELARAESQHYWEWEKQKSTRSSSLDSREYLTQPLKPLLHHSPSRIWSAPIGPLPPPLIEEEAASSSGEKAMEESVRSSSFPIEHGRSNNRASQHLKTALRKRFIPVRSKTESSLSTQSSVLSENTANSSVTDANEPEIKALTTTSSTNISTTDPTTPSPSIEYKLPPWRSGAFPEERDTVPRNERGRATSDESHCSVEASPTGSTPSYDESVAATPAQDLKAWRGTRHQSWRRD